MNTRQLELWHRIQAYPIDDPSSPQPFTERLARENGWTRSHARRVADEYKRFVLLCLTAGHPCTPSQAVDEAWHLHLIHTRAYWDDFCGGVLGQPLHHDPTRGGAEEEEKFRDWYARTLESYRACFVTEPPRDIWGAPARPTAPETPPTGSKAPGRAREPRRPWSPGLRLGWFAGTAAAALATMVLWWQLGPTPAPAHDAVQSAPSLRAEFPWADWMPVVIAIVVVGPAIKFFSSLGNRSKGKGGSDGSCGSSGCTSDSRSGAGHDGGCGDSGSSDGGGGCDGGGSGCGGGGCGGGGD